MKSCSNCYYLEDGEGCTTKRTRPIEQICNSHQYGCDKCRMYNGECTEVAQFKYGDKYYCADCLAEIIGIEKREYTAYQYFDAHGDFIGNSEDTDLEDVLRNYSRCELIEED